MWGNAYRATTVCVDTYHHRVLSGRLYNPALPAEGLRFESLVEFLLAMEDLLNETHFPQSFTAVRSFRTSSQRGSRARRRADGNREAGHLYGVGALPPEHQLARICILAGNRTGRKLPQCAGTGPADEQRIGNFRIIPAGNAARLVIPARRRRTRQDGKIRPVEIAARANRRKRRDAKQGG